MWIFTTIGFFSVTRSKTEPEKMQIRAREKKDLEALIAVAAIPGHIMETPVADYRWRIITEPQTAINAITILAGYIDYSNFKHAVHDNPNQASKGGAYLRVWNVMRSVQDDPRAFESSPWEPHGHPSIDELPIFRNPEAKPREAAEDEPFQPLVPKGKKAKAAKGGGK